MKKFIVFLLVLASVFMSSGVLWAGERNLIGNWSTTFKGYYGNETIGTHYVQIHVVLHITKQEGRSFAGTAQFKGQTQKYLITGNINADKINIILGGNIFIVGNACDTSNGVRLYLIMEIQRMSVVDSQGVLDGTASKM
jgi:hypothetical protein